MLAPGTRHAAASQRPGRRKVGTVGRDYPPQSRLVKNAATGVTPRDGAFPTALVSTQLAPSVRSTSAALPGSDEHVEDVSLVSGLVAVPGLAPRDVISQTHPPTPLRASRSCGIGSWGGQRPSLADYVRGPAATRGAIAARAC